MMIKNLQRYYTLKCLIRDLLSNVFVSPKFWLAKVFNLSCGRGNEMSTNIVWYLYSFCALFVVYEAVLDNKYIVLFIFRLPMELFDPLWYCIISLCSFCHHFLSCFEDRISLTRSGEGHCKMLDNAVITNDIFWKYDWKQITDSTGHVNFDYQRFFFDVSKTCLTGSYLG